MLGSINIEDMRFQILASSRGTGSHRPGLFAITYHFAVVPVQLAIVGISIWMVKEWFSLLQVAHAWKTDPNLATSLVAVLNATITSNQDLGLKNDGLGNNIMYASSEIEEIERFGT